MSFDENVQIFFSSDLGVVVFFLYSYVKRKKQEWDAN